MQIYIDDDFKCHISNELGIYREVEDIFFDDKCSAFIEGYRFVPYGEVWTREDGIEFTGKMITPCRNYDLLASAQIGYDEAEEKNLIGLAELIEQIYNEDLEMIDA